MASLLRSVSRVLICVAIAASFGCGASKSAAGSGAAGKLAGVAGSPSPASAGAGSSAKAPSHAPSPPPASSESEPPSEDLDGGTSGQRAAFVIALSTSECSERCPAYDLKLNQNGDLEFNGRGNTRQQGWIGKTVAPEVAAEVLQALRDAKYWELEDVYRTAADGCKEIVAGRATHTWNVTADGKAKIVVDSLGCTGIAQLDALRRIPELLRDKLEIANWLGD